jgi:hypothetical protein
MKLIRARHLAWGAWLPPALAAMALCSLPVTAAERVVICEHFTDND